MLFQFFSDCVGVILHEKTFPLFLNFILNHERNAEGKYHTRIRDFSVNFVYKTFYGVLPVNNDNSNDKSMPCDNMCMDRSDKIG